MADIRISALPSGVADLDGILAVVNAAGTTTEQVRVRDLVGLVNTPSFSAAQTAPAVASAGDLWLNPDSVLHVYDGSSWVAVAPDIDFEPTVVSIATPRPARVVGALWVNPLSITPAAADYSNDNPPSSTTAAVASDADGTPFFDAATGIYTVPEYIGEIPVEVRGRMYALEFFDADGDVGEPVITYAGTTRTAPAGSLLDMPDYVGGIPIVLAGQKYLIPLAQPTASLGDKPALKFVDPLTLYSAGQPIVAPGGFDFPDVIAAFPISVNGVTRLAPLIEY